VSVDELSTAPPAARDTAASRPHHNPGSGIHPGRPTASPLPRRVHVDGIGFHPLTEAQVLDRIFHDLSTGTGGFVVTPNVDIVRQLRRGSLQEITDRASLVVADGMPVVWASRLAARPLPARVSGSSLVRSLAGRAARTGRSVYLLGGAPGIAGRAADNLAAQLPTLRPVRWACPALGFENDPRQLAGIVEGLRAAAPDIVLVGLGFPKQEQLILRLHEQFPATWFVGCGGGLTMLAGAVDRAPGWAQRSGLEWAHRLAREPRRLARRYLVDDAPFAIGMLARAAASRFRRSPADS